MTATNVQPAPFKKPALSVGQAVWRISTCVLIAYVLFLLLLLLFERRLVFPASPWDSSLDPKTKDPLRQIQFNSLDGTSLHALYLPCPNPRVVILYLHGNGGNIGHRSSLLNFLSHRFRASILGLSYRGYGKSEGKPSEQGIYQDAQAALNKLMELESVDISRVLVISRSMGAAVGLKLAIDNSLPALSMESTFTSMPDVAALQYRWLPVSLFMKTRFASDSRIAQYQGRLLQSHGEHDNLIPIAMARNLHGLARCDKQFIVIDNGGHNDQQSDRYYDALELLIQQSYETEQ